MKLWHRIIGTATGFALGGFGAYLTRILWGMINDPKVDGILWVLLGVSLVAAAMLTVSAAYEVVKLWVRP